MPSPPQSTVQSRSPKPDAASGPANPAPADARPSLRPPRPNFDLEPNPFEQSFSRNSNTSSSSVPSLKSQDTSDADTVVPSAPNGKQVGADEPKPVLPPLAALSSPSDPAYAWGLSSSGLTNSLRSGPLSPAMLAGPQNSTNGGSNFESAFSRTGFTPDVSRTGLTPLVGGPTSFPPPSPNTAAFLAMVTNPTTAAAMSSSVATITPNTLSALTGVVPNHNPHPLSVSHVPQTWHQPTSAASDPYTSSAANAATTAANGLFLLSQAHQELTKREEAQARASTDQSAAAKKGAIKRKSIDAVPPAPAETAKRPRAATMGSNAKKTRNGRKKDTSPSAESMDGEAEEDEMDDDEYIGEPIKPTVNQVTVAPAATGGRNQKKQETDEEKRKNFLERNRQAALKCRQRKKAWLAQLQQKVEFLSTENERLTSALASSREEISRLSALVANNGGVSAGKGAAQAINGGPQPVSVAVPIQGKSASRGYGY